MNKAVPWNINGVGFDAREAAREAARRQGKSLGEWLDGVIAEHAAEIGMDAAGIDSRDRIEAVKTRLEELGARADDGYDGEGRPVRALRERGLRRERPASNRSGSRSRSGRDEDEPHVHRAGAGLTPRHRRSGSRGIEDLDDGGRPETRRMPPSYNSPGETEWLLEEAVEAMERRATRAERKSEKALDSIEKIIDATESIRDDEHEMFRALSRRLSEMEERIASRTNTGDYGPVKGALARLEARLDTLGRRNQREPHGMALAPVASQNSPAYAPGAHPDTARSEASSRVRLSDAIAGIAAHQRHLDSGYGAPYREPVAPDYRGMAFAASPPAERPYPSASYPTPTHPPAPSSFAQGFATHGSAALAQPEYFPAPIEPMQAHAAPAGSPDLAPRAQHFAQDNAPVSNIQEPAARPRALTRPSEPVASGETSSLRREIAALEAKIDEMRDGMAARETAKNPAGLDNLAAEIAKMSLRFGDVAPEARAGAIDEVIAAILARAGAVKPPVAAPASSPGDSVSAAIRALFAKDQNHWPQESHRSQDHAHVQDHLASRDHALDKIERRLDALGSKIDQAVEQAAHQIRQQAEPPRAPLPNPAPLDQLDGVRALFRRLPDVPASSSKLEKQLEALAAKIDQAVHEASGARQVAESSKHQFEQVQQKLAAAAEAPRGASEPLEAIVRDLSDRIEAARAPEAGQSAIEALQHQIVELSRRFETSDTGLAALPAIERSMQTLFAQIEDTKSSVEAAAAKAAREAAEAVAAGQKTVPAAAGEIAGLKKLQEQADQRAHATLNALQETLEKVAGRLAMMEDELAGVRSGRFASAPSIQASSIQAPSILASSLQAPAPQFAAPGQPKAKPEPGSARAAMPDLMLDSSNLLGRPVAPGRAGAEAKPRAVEPDNNMGRADFIAAARRAARTAQNDPSVVALKRMGGPEVQSELRAGLITKTRDYVETHKKPILMSVAALFVMIGTLAIIGGLHGDPSGTKIAASLPPAKVTQSAPRGPESAALGAQPVNIPSRANHVTAAELSPSALPKAPPPMGSNLSGVDPMPTGSIAPLPSFASIGQPGGQANAAAGSAAVKKMAEAGNAAAEYELASRYTEGRAAPKDFAQAAVWYDKAARQGLAPAQYKLASLYEKGLGVARDPVKARAWYGKAAEAGNPRAMHNLAVMIADGDGKPDYEGAAAWFRKAAEYGIHDSQYNLAILYARGLGVKQSLIQSYQWFAVAAQQNDPDAAKKRDDVGAKLTKDDLTIANALATSFHPKVADTAVTEVEPPPGGWDGVTPSTALKSERPKVSSL